MRGENKIEKMIVTTAIFLTCPIGFLGFTPEVNQIDYLDDLCLAYIRQVGQVSVGNRVRIENGYVGQFPRS